MAQRGETICYKAKTFVMHDFYFIFDLQVACTLWDTTGVVSSNAQTLIKIQEQVTWSVAKVNHPPRRSLCEMVSTCFTDREEITWEQFNKRLSSQWKCWDYFALLLGCGGHAWRTETARTSSLTAVIAPLRGPRNWADKMSGWRWCVMMWN